MKVIEIKKEERETGDQEKLKAGDTEPEQNYYSL